MKNRMFVLVLVGVVFLSCNKETKSKVEDTTPKVEEILTKECYQYIRGNDTILASLLVESNNVSGDLVYNLFEKDKNSGTVIGTIKGDTLVANYTFVSEGTTSVRQVAFLRSKKMLIEGYGESIEKQGKMVFKDASKLNFTSTIFLKKIPCK